MTIRITCSFSRRVSSSVTSVTSITSTSTVRDDSWSDGTASRLREKREEGRFNWECGGLALALTRLADSTATPLATRPSLPAGAFPINAEARHAEQEATARSLCTRTMVVFLCAHKSVPLLARDQQGRDNPDARSAIVCGSFPSMGPLIAGTTR